MKNISNKMISIVAALILLSSVSYSQWTDITPPYKVNPGNCLWTSFVNPLTGYVQSNEWDGKAHNYIRKTTDAGNNWLMVAQDSSAPGGKGVFLNDSTGVFYSLKVLFTKNSLKTIDTIAEFNNVESVSFGKNSEIFISTVLPDTSVYKSNNFFNTWKKVSNHPITRIHFVDDSLGFGYGYDINIKKFKIYKTIDSGESWVNTLNYYNFFFKKLQFVNNLIGFGSNSILMKTNDGGKTWDTSFDWTNFVSDFHFINDSIGFLLYPEGVVFTTDAGTKWKFLPMQPPKNQFDQMQVFYKNSKFYIFLSQINRGGTLIYKGIFDSIQIWNTTNELTQINSKDKYKIYPNPAIDKITISYTGFVSPGKTIRLYDMQGKLVKEKRFGLGKTTLNMASLGKGVYLIKIQDGEAVVVRKVVKE